MALIKEKEVGNTGITGNYWRIARHATDFLRRTESVTLELYKSEKAREEGKDPVGESFSFHFTKNDYPYHESDSSMIDINRVNDLEDFRMHGIYQHIKAIAVIAHEKQSLAGKLPPTSPEIPNQNEENALFFYDAVDSFDEGQGV